MMTRSWTIGSSPDCDLVVNLPKVSGHHCRLSREGDGYVLEDLGSTNGTYLDGVRIDCRVRVRPGDAVTLGVATPMPWPSDDSDHDRVVLRIGRKPDNDFVVDQPGVSDYHARIIREGDEGVATIEDLGSASGTALGSVDRKITRSALTATDMVYLGTHGVPAASLLARIGSAPFPMLAFRGDELVIGRAPDCTLVLDLPMVSGHHARLDRSGDRTWIEDLGSSNGTYVNGRRVSGRVAVASGDTIGVGSYCLVLAVELPDRAVGNASATIDASSSTSTSAGNERSLGPSWGFDVLLLLVQAPLLALLITMALKVEGPGPAGPEGSGVVSRATVGSLYWLGLAAIWFGLSSAVLGMVLDATRSRERPTPEGAATFGLRLLRLGLLAVGQCVVAWVLVAIPAGLRGPGLPVLAFLILASVVGLAQGLLIVAAVPRPRPALAMLAVVVLAMGLLGGGPWPLDRMPSPLRMLAYAVPTRWTFEGLLLLVLERAPRPEADEGAGHGPAVDVADEAFPAGSEAMGLRADTMALALMAIGMTVVAGFIAHDQRRVL
jgi:pSer/pThr/pTyr-binding forkhead associated (FHA) protein